MGGEPGTDGQGLIPPVEEPGLRVTLASLFAAGADHVAALFSLFLLEASDVVRRLKGKIVCLVVGIFLLFIGYLFACVLLTMYLKERFDDVILALACVGGAHLLFGVIFLCIGIWKRLGPFAPETIQELKTDYECLQIAIKENKNL